MRGSSAQGVAGRLLAVALTGLVLVAAPACGSSESAGTGAPTASASSPAGIRTLAPKDASATLTGGRVVVDLRTAGEFAAGHLAGAKDLDFYQSTFKDELGKLDRNTAYLIYCHSGNRSGQAREMMTQLGFTDVVEVKGGIAAWTADGLPVER